MNQQQLIDKALKQIQADMEAEDMTAIEELLRAAPLEAIAAYLPETTTQEPTA